MRRIVLIYFALSAFLFSSCNDFLDKEPDDALTLEMVFDDKQRVEEWLAGIYLNIPLVGYFEQFGATYFSDDAQLAPALGQFDVTFNWIVVNNQGGVNPTVKPSVDYWGEYYKSVRSAYILLKNIKPLPDQGLRESDVEQMKMEARFLIAYYYSRLLEIYGPFPLVTQAISSDTPLNELLLPRTPYENIVQWLDNEFLELSEFFPAVYSNPDKMFGRPTKGLCLALRSRMWLYAASPLFNGNPDYADMKNPDGTPIFPAQYDADKWKKAADATRGFLDLAETGVYELYTERYKNGEIDPFLSFQNLFLKTADKNKEIIFARPRGENHYINVVGNPRGVAGRAGYYGSTQNLADVFFMKNGLSPIQGYESNGNPIINSVSGYSEEGFTNSQIFYPNTSYNMGGADAREGLVVDAGTFMMYANREPRFYITLWYDNEWIPLVQRKTQFKSGGLDGGPTHDSPQCGYLTRKGVNPEADPRNQKFPYQPSILLRLGEFYLNYAEALNEAKPGDLDILKYLNRIRERAGIPVYGTAPGQIPVPANQNAMREAIRKERRVELAIETDVRYNDIRRWKIAEELFQTPIYGMNRNSSNNDYYRRTVYMTRSFEKKNYLWPIYQDYMDNNPNLVQNKFW